MLIVLANGVFDVLHVGHLRHLEEARAMGGMLVVGVTRDKFVGKGKGKPVIPEEERVELLRGLHCVSKAVLCDSGVDALIKVKPDIFVKGSEYKDSLLKEEIEHCRRNGIEIRHTSFNPQRTSKIIERIKNG